MCLFRCFNEITDERSPVAGLRLRRERPDHRRAPDQCDELAPVRPRVHSITSSAPTVRGTELWNMSRSGRHLSRESRRQGGGGVFSGYGVTARIDLFADGTISLYAENPDARLPPAAN